jgi:hypothetical protein
MSHHLGGDISAHDSPKDEGMWSHLLNLWDNGEKRPRVVILEGGDVQGESRAARLAVEWCWCSHVHLGLNQFTSPIELVLNELTPDVLPASLSSPSFYLADDAESVLEPFKTAAAEALERVAKLPVVKQLLDTLDLATSSTSS